MPSREDPHGSAGHGGAADAGAAAALAPGRPGRRAAPKVRRARPKPPIDQTPRRQVPPATGPAGHAWPRPHARDEDVRSQPGSTRSDGQRLADLQRQTAQLERELSEARTSLERELAQAARGWQSARGNLIEANGYLLDDADDEPGADRMSALLEAPVPSANGGGRRSGAHGYTPEDRTEVLINQGRRSARRVRLTRGHKAALGSVAATVAVAVAAVILFTGRASWPSSVAAVQSQAAKACENPDVKSAPGRVNFACADATRQILWVFALLTSGNNPRFVDAKTGRMGLEPIMPAQGGQVAWSLNFNHPYDPANPVDSIAVAARAINNIIGGATVTAADGRPVVQAGLEGRPANCLRYTGSAAVTARKGYPPLCARPVASAAGQAALVADVYRKWVVGASPQEAQNAGVLFQNADNPGNPRVQAILRQVSSSRAPA
jgi:hypothetical protein